MQGYKTQTRYHVCALIAQLNWRAVLQRPVVFGFGAVQRCKLGAGPSHENKTTVSYIENADLTTTSQACDTSCG